MPPSRDPRPAPRYDYGVHGQSDQGSLGAYILKPGVNARIKKPSWKGTETVFRAYPSLFYEDPNKFEPYRLDPGGRNVFSNWIRRYDCWWSTGTPATTLLIHNPEDGDRGYDKWQSPLGVLYTAVEGAVKKRSVPQKYVEEWYALREGSAGKGKALRAPTECYLMQGAVLCHNSQPTFGHGKPPWGWGPQSPTMVLAVSKGAGQNLEGQLNEEKPGYRGDPADFEARYVCGDPVAVDHGRYIHFFEKGHDPRNRMPARSAGPSPFSSSGWSGSSQVRKGDDIGFDVFLDDSYMGMPANIPDDSIEMVKDKFLFWEDILFFPTFEEQARILFDIFPISACLYAFEGQHNSWIPEGAREKLANAMKASVPADPPGRDQAASPPAQPGGGHWAQGTTSPPAPTGNIWAGQPSPALEASRRSSEQPPRTHLPGHQAAAEEVTDSSVPAGVIDDGDEEDVDTADFKFGPSPSPAAAPAAPPAASPTTKGENGKPLEADAAVVARNAAARSRKQP